jgi:signal transduction histidine kinase
MATTRPPASPQAALPARLRASYRYWWSGFTVKMQKRPPPPGWLQLLWTFVFCVEVALFFTALAWMFNVGRVALWPVFISNLKISVCVGYSIHGLFRLAGEVCHRNNINPETFGAAGRTAFFAGIPMLGVMIGVALALLLNRQNPFAFALDNPVTIISMLSLSLLMSVMLSFVYVAVARKRALEAAAAQSQAQAQALQRQAAEAQLKALQAQIEPHFLFNTLANVVSLIDYDAPQAKRMLEAFIDYLRATLDANRRTQGSVGDELDVVERYLQLLQFRMGARLRYAIAADDGVRQLPLPPLLLQPLVENAVKHGLEPKVGPGAVSITARASDDALELTVRDSGVGLNGAASSSEGNGLALQNIRERLAGLYGERASLRIESAAPQGTLATVRIPLDDTMHLPPPPAGNR